LERLVMADASIFSLGQKLMEALMDRQEMVEMLSPDVCRVELAVSLYEREAILAAAERLNESFYIKVEACGEKSHAVLIRCKDERNACDIEKRALEFVNDALEEQVRLDLMRRTGALREIIYRHAFLPLEEQKEKP
jgi:His-Xaa-Ser system protein HxsD